MNNNHSLDTSSKTAVNSTLTSLNERASDLLVSIAVVGLTAAVADGEPDEREIRHFINSFQKHFALSKRSSLRHISAALKKIRQTTHERALECALEDLNEHLDLRQKVMIFERIAEILVIDGVIREGEESFIAMIAGHLGLLDQLKSNISIE